MDIFTQTRLLRAPSSLALNVCRDGASTTSLGNLFQCFTTLIVKNFFFISSYLNTHGHLNRATFSFRWLHSSWSHSWPRLARSCLLPSPATGTSGC